MATKKKEEFDFLNNTEVDAAYYILSKKGEAMFYKDLVLEVIDKKRKPAQSLSNAIAEVYTLINMDSRFHYEGEGLWGLTAWNPPEVKRSSSKSASGGAKTTRRREKLLEGIQEE
ncbi:hypothetical protein TAMA11512_06130 [Selenomonas sp. TAMA-11512]|uniref:DNA-directed RNA polymerase subunit delta n=1 Tax=Selenomonas sp. TAMA-11512 TaxID=3095337 RepID=UPI00308F9412|nr:hypothetical protein TAMA11512_06130 [Selenomonas sp. TAMA-11512]